MDKFRISWSVFTAILADRPLKDNKPLPKNLQRSEISKLEYTCVLVLRDHPEEALAPVDEAINQEIDPLEKKIHCIKNIKVINGMTAEKYGIIKELME